MPSKRVDERIRELLASGLRTRQRSLLVLVGDRGREQAVTLHALLHKLALELPLPTAGGAGAAAPVRPRAATLWCYQRDLGFSTHRNKRAVRGGRRRHRWWREGSRACATAAAAAAAAAVQPSNLPRASLSRLCRRS